MRIVINPSCNLSEAAIRRYDAEVTPQHIIVNGEAHDTRVAPSLEQIDRWVRESREFPHMVGTTAQEFVGVFRRLLRDDPEVLAIMTSKNVIQSYTAATSAARTLQALGVPGNVGVVDSMMTDAGAGLLAIAAGEAARAGLDVRRATPVLDALARRARFAFVVKSVDYLVKGGRASWLKGWLASVLEMRPMIAFVNGELKSVGKISGKDDPAEALVNDAVAAFAGRPLWVAVYHGGMPAKARDLASKLSRRLDVRYVYQRILSPGVYVYAGAGTLGYAAFPIDDLPWTPTTPPDLSE
jgi:DegV family protein with EDD domain